MTNLIKTLKIAGVLVIVLLTSCSKNDDSLITFIKYRLTLTAKAPAEGNTVFSTISYKNEDGATETLSNVSDDFIEAFDISIGYNIQFSVSGTNDATLKPSPAISYTVERFENDVNKGIICFGSSVSMLGSAGSWSFTSNVNSTFNGTICD